MMTVSPFQSGLSALGWGWGLVWVGGRLIAEGAEDGLGMGTSGGGVSSILVGHGAGDLHVGRSASGIGGDVYPRMGYVGPF